MAASSEAPSRQRSRARPNLSTSIDYHVSSPRAFASRSAASHSLSPPSHAARAASSAQPARRSATIFRKTIEAPSTDISTGESIVRPASSIITQEFAPADQPARSRNGASKAISGEPERHLDHRRRRERAASTAYWLARAALIAARSSAAFPVER